MKKWLKISLITFAAGILFLIAGFTAGAGKWVYLDWEGIHVVRNEDTPEAFETDLDPFHTVEITVGSSDVEIIRGGDYKLRITGADSSKVEWKQEDGKLSIQEEHRWYFFSWNFWWGYDNRKITVYLPADVSLQTIDIRDASGSVSIPEMDCESVTVHVTSGKVNLSALRCESLKAEVSSGNLNIARSEIARTDLAVTSGDMGLTGCRIGSGGIRVTSGTMKASGITASSLDMSGTSGDIEFQGKLSGENTVKMTSGTVRLSLEGSPDDFFKTVNMTSGSLYINGKKMDGYSDLSQTVPDRLTIRVTSGNVHLNFSE